MDYQNSLKKVLICRDRLNYSKKIRILPLRLTKFAIAIHYNLQQPLSPAED